MGYCVERLTVTDSDLVLTEVVNPCVSIVVVVTANKRTCFCISENISLVT